MLSRRRPVSTFSDLGNLILYASLQWEISQPENFGVDQMNIFKFVSRTLVRLSAKNELWFISVLAIRMVPRLHRLILMYLFSFSFGATGGRKLSNNPGGFGGATLYVFGSGSTINQLSLSAWADIEKSFSLGINDCVYHPHLFNFYSTELFKSEHYVEKSWTKLSDRAQSADVLRVLIKMPPQTKRFSWSFPHKKVWEKSHGLVPVHPDTTNAGSYKSSVQLYLSTIPRKLRRFLVLDGPTSVVRALFWAESVGFRKIILVGVDLENSKYFWENYPEAEVLSRLRINELSVDAGSSNTPHPSNQPNVGVPAEIAIQIVSECFAERGIEILLGSEGGALDGRITRLEI